MVKLALVATSSLIALSMATVAAAQSGKPPSQAAVAPLSSEPGAAMTAEPAGPVVPTAVAPPSAPADSEPSVGEVVVTAQRRVQRLQDVPVTVEAVSATQLANSGIASMTDLKTVVPGINIANSAGFAVVYVRGVGSNAVGPGIENPVATYVDGVYYASTSSTLLDFLNVERVEVLKGPQGTLFGRNATGGLIQIVTKDPKQDFHMDADIGYGNYRAVNGDIYVTGAILPNVRSDLAFLVSHADDGWGTDYTTGKPVYKNDLSLAARSKTIWTPTDTTKFTLIVDYSRQHNSFLVDDTPPGSIVPPIYGYTRPAGEGRYDINQDLQPLFKNQNGGISLKLDQDLAFATLSNIVAYRRSSSQINFDLDQTPVPSSGVALTTDEHQLSEELQLSSRPHSTLQWVLGTFYYNSSAAYDPGLILFPSSDPDLNAAYPIGTIATIARQKAESLAVYGQASYPILRATNLTLGARYTYEKRTFVGNDFGFLLDGTPLGALDAVDASKSFTKPTFRVALDHRFSPEILAYASFNTGFKSGGFNTQTVTDPPFRPESLSAYEVGVKTDLLNRRLQLNVSGFYYNYRDLQVQFLELATTGVRNGASARLYGADVDFSAFITSNLSVTGGMEFLDARFTSFPDGPISAPNAGVPVTEGSLTGDFLPLSPKFTLNLAPNYKVDLQSAGTLNFTATYFHSSRYYTEPDNVYVQKAFDKINLSMRWKSASQRYSAALWVKNLTNVVTTSVTGSFPDGVRATTLEAPRTYGATIGISLN